MLDSMALAYGLRLIAEQKVGKLLLAAYISGKDGRH
jgi:hypothetical protein